MNAGTRVDGIPVRWHEVPGGPLGCWVPERPDDFVDELDEKTFRDTDERMPYFATLWPAGEALAAALLEDSDLTGRTALDLGCGVGLVGLAAGLRGARVTFLDWEPRSLRLVAASADSLGVEPGRLVAADWREASDLGTFDLVLAADVLYEARNVAPVVAFLGQRLDEGGTALLADPRRQHAATFPEAVRSAGLRLLPKEVLPYRPRGVAVDLWRVQRGGPTT